MMERMDHTIRDEWQLSDFTQPTVTPEGVELLLSPDGGTCIIIYPWHFDRELVETAIHRAVGMGFTHITEMGNLYPYTVTGSDTDDSDYVLLEVDQ